MVTAESGPATQSPLKALKAQVAKCKQVRKDRVPEWATNVDYRRGKLVEGEGDETRQPLTLDWSLTKAKHAQLFSQMPEIVGTPTSPDYAPATQPFVKRVNYWLKQADCGGAMNEGVPDIINAAGIGIILVAYETRTQQKDVPVIDPANLPPEAQMLLQQGQFEIPTEPMPVVMDQRFTITRISPADFLWPTTFRHSNFDKAPWLGYSGKKTWAEAQMVFKLTDEDKDKVCGESRSPLEQLTPDLRQMGEADRDVVEYDEVYYWRYLYHPDEMSFVAIQRVVWVRGKEAPVVDEPWTGQRVDEATGQYVGACRFPIRVGTLTYVTDEAIPPSDSAIGRPQVDALIKDREQMFEQREHSLPIRWMDVNRVDPTIQALLQRGHWQGIIPVNGSGDKAIGEVARANYPAERYDFARTAKMDLQESWNIGNNQRGVQNTSGEHSAAESRIAQQNFQTQVGQDRAHIVDWFMGIADVLAGLISLYDEFELPAISEQDKQRLSSWDREHIRHEVAFSIRADASVLLDAEQRVERIIRFIDHTAKSGFLNAQPVLEELASLSGFDPALVIKAPEPKGPEMPNVSFRFSGAQDLVDPIALTILMNAGLAPKDPQELEAAINLIAAANTGAQVAVHTADDAAEDHLDEPKGQVMEDRAPQWGLADRVNKRREPGKGA